MTCDGFGRNFCRNAMRKDDNIVRKESEEKRRMEKMITEQAVQEFRIWLIKAGKGIATIQKYLRDLKKLECFLAGDPIDRERVLAYKKMLWDCGEYKISSINSFLVAANRFCKFMGWHEIIVETYQVQEEIFR